MKNIFNIKSKLSCFVMQRSCSLMEWHPECSSVGGTVVQNTAIPPTCFQRFTDIGVLTCGSLNDFDFKKLEVHKAIPKVCVVLP